MVGTPDSGQRRGRAWDSARGVPASSGGHWRQQAFGQRHEVGDDQSGASPPGQGSPRRLIRPRAGGARPLHVEQRIVADVQHGTAPGPVAHRHDGRSPGVCHAPARGDMVAEWPVGPTRCRSALPLVSSRGKTPAQPLQRGQRVGIALHLIARDETGLEGRARRAVVVIAVGRGPRAQAELALRSEVVGEVGCRPRCGRARHAWPGTG